VKRGYDPDEALRQPPVCGGISAARKELAARRLELYQRKRGLINAIERLDIVEDAALIARIANSLPESAWKLPDRKHWRD
jgi:hypothetical protein